MGLVKLGKGLKSKNMDLKVRDTEDEEFYEDKQTKFKAYITRQFNKFIKNANVKLKEKDRKKIGFNSNKPLRQA